MIDICEQCHEPLEPDRDGCDPGLCWDCTEAHDFEAEDDEDPLPTEPSDDDYVTSDYVFFYRHGFRSSGPIVIVKEGCNWAKVVESRMDHDEFWPNVWYIGERGDVNLIDMFEELHSEEQ
jgi:hypothetical protein